MGCTPVELVEMVGYHQGDHLEEQEQGDQAPDQDQQVEDIPHPHSHPACLEQLEQLVDHLSDPALHHLSTPLVE